MKAFHRAVSDASGRLSLDTAKEPRLRRGARLPNKAHRAAHYRPK